MTDLSHPTPAQASAQASAPVADPPPKPPQHEDNDFPFAVALGEIYEGPLDLLLDLIRKQDINI